MKKKKMSNRTKLFVIIGGAVILSVYAIVISLFIAAFHEPDNDMKRDEQMEAYRYSTVEAAEQPDQGGGCGGKGGHGRRTWLVLTLRILRDA
jgi:hypothetical protein